MIILPIMGVLGYIGFVIAERMPTPLQEIDDEAPAAIH